MSAIGSGDLPTVIRGTLFVVATPIGNLADLSSRARELLARVDLIAAEDTRHTGRLLLHFGIETPQFALHEHNEKDVVEPLVERLRGGASIALVSDAGTPLVSDPGYRFVLAAHRAGIPVLPVPGPSASLAALSVAGLPTDRFCFEGFLPARPKARRDRLEALRSEPRTMIFYASVHRIRETLADCAQAFGAARPACLARELTKRHEQVAAATLGDLRAMLEDGRIPDKGEFVLVVGGSDAPEKSSEQLSEDRLLAALASALPAGKAAAVAAAVTGKPRNELYRRLLAL
ncbi:MAG TPA: 16S rRNA (cytidine(1402)-2'-O)-methyltransferase [Woeseiaceae bacterium]|nr:16S rRNA (cytidine(1402)-2'-O)-methyltransferase [Woeseiaceae bacterium]